MNTLIITMDPGAHKVGLSAGWLEDDKPFFITTLDVKTNLRGYARAIFVGNEAARLLACEWHKNRRGAARAVVAVEAMQADKRTDDNKVKDILDCQATGTAFASKISDLLVAMFPNVGLTVLSPTPSEWIKGMSKDVMRRQLMEQWPDVVSAKTGHDAVSAAGLFRWALPFARFS